MRSFVSPPKYAANEQSEIVASLRKAKPKEPGRTEFARMLEIVEKGGADGILAWHPDRLTPETKTWMGERSFLTSWSLAMSKL